MRIVAVGAVAATVLGAALAAMPISSVSTPVPDGGTCGNSCQRLASVLMPDAGPPTVKPATDNLGATPIASAANVIAPGAGPDPGQASGATAVPGVSTGPSFSSGSSASGASGDSGLPAVSGAGLPALPSDPIDALQALGISNPGATLQGLATAAVLPGSVSAAYSLLSGVVGVGTSLVGTVTEAAIAITYLQNAGILPKNLASLLPSGLVPTALPSLNLPVLQAAAAIVPGGLPALSGLNLSALQAAAAIVPGGLPALSGLNLPALQAVVAAIPGGGLPALSGLNLPALQAAAAAIPGGGLPALSGLNLPALQALAATIPHSLPALPPPPPLPALPHHLCAPGAVIPLCTP
jgi:hypothetical protein